MPEGDPEAGRRSFAEFEGYKWSPVAGRNLPKADSTGDVGPDLSRTEPLHPLEPSAEAIGNPYAVLTEGQGFLGPDRKCKMPSHTETMMLQRLIKRVAYLRRLGTGSPAPGGPGGEGAAGRVHRTH